MVATDRIFEDGMAVLGEMFNREITPVLAKGYRLGLRGLTDAQFVRAVEHLLVHHEAFLPTPAQIVAAVEATMTARERGDAHRRRLILAAHDHGFLAPAEADALLARLDAEIAARPAEIDGGTTPALGASAAREQSVDE